MPITRIVYETKKTAPLEKDEAMMLSGLLAVSEKEVPVKMPRILVKSAVPAQNAMTAEA